MSCGVVRREGGSRVCFEQWTHPQVLFRSSKHRSQCGRQEGGEYVWLLEEHGDSSLFGVFTHEIQSEIVMPAKRRPVREAKKNGLSCLAGYKVVENE